MNEVHGAWSVAVPKVMCFLNPALFSHSLHFSEANGGLFKLFMGSITTLQ